MVGDSLIHVLKDTRYVDLGAVAIDDRDGRIDITADVNVDVSTVGVYQVTYSATDAAGNIRTALERFQLLMNM